MAELLFEDTFIIAKINSDGKKFEKVSRIEARSEQLNMDMILDVATDVYPMKVGERFTMVLASTLNIDGTPDSGYYTQDGRKSLADQYEYVMYGKIYRSCEDSGKGEINASFGGLLMSLKGDVSSTSELDQDQRIFLLIKKL